jgi:hypothetical protein
MIRAVKIGRRRAMHGSSERAIMRRALNKGGGLGGGAGQPDRSRFDRATGRVASVGFGCGTGWRTAARRLVLAQALVDDLAQQVVVRPSEKFDLGDDLGPRPRHAA